MLVARLLGHGLMQIGVEHLADRVLAGDAIALENADKGALGALEALAQLADQPVFVLALGGKRGEAALQVLGSFNDILGKFLHGILAGIFHLALGARAVVLHLGLGAHPFVAEFLDLRLKLGNAGFRGLGLGLCFCCLGGRGLVLLFVQRVFSRHRGRNLENSGPAGPGVIGSASGVLPRFGASMAARSHERHRSTIPGCPTVFSCPVLGAAAW